ncbi:MAG: peptidylprolyl isomerase [Burkholderiales bacterium]|nr:peptidylprolyl isomerase [Burkholderiales bacterium]
MFDFFRRHTRVLQFALVLLIFPSFVFFGIQGYSRFAGGENTKVATVAGQGITQAEWDATHREQIERVRRQMPDVDTRLFDTPQMKAQALESLVRDRVIQAAVRAANLYTSDERLLRIFSTEPELAFLRNPDGSVNPNALAAQGMSSEQLAERLRQDLTRKQVLAGLSSSAFAPAAATASALDAMFQQREVQLQRFDPKDYLAKVNPSDAELEAYYKNPANAAQFQAAEKASVEYLVLDIEGVKKGLNVPEEELRSYYNENTARFTTPEERRASHILIKAEKSASAEIRAKAKAKAESLLEEATKKGASFAELARKNSDDPGSAERGGDLDFFARGNMVKPFEDAAFALKAGETSGVVESDFGYHIIRVTAVRGGEKKSFEAVRAEIEDERKKQLAQKEFAEKAVAFSNMVEDQSDSLAPAAQKFKLEVHKAKDVTRSLTPDAKGPLAQAKVLEALFATDSVKSKRNTLAIDIGANQLVSARIVEHTPARQLPFAEVLAAVRAQVKGTQAAEMARKEGAARLAALQAAPHTALSEPVQAVSRAQARNLPRPVLDAVLKAPVTALPSVLGIDLKDEGYTVARLIKVLGRDPAAGAPAQGQQQFTQAWADAESQAYYAALKHRFKVELSVPASAAASANAP